MFPDLQVCVLRGEHGPPRERLHHRHRLLMEGEPYLARDQGGLVGYVEHGVVHLHHTKL